MSSKEALKKITELVNPSRVIKGHWSYISVEVQYPIRKGIKDIKPEREIELHEIFFDNKGNVTGITSGAVSIGSSTKNELVTWLTRAARDVRRLPVIPWKYWKHLKH